MKKIIVAAIIGGVAIPAYAETKVYGIAGLVLTSQKTEMADGSSNDPGIQVNSGGQSSSRFGVKGSQQISEAIKMVYKLEGGVGLDSGSFSGFKRNAWVGMSGRYGQITGGLQWTPYDDAYFEIDAQQYATWSAQYMVINNTKGLGGIGSHGDTFNRGNSLVYRTPEYNGSQFKVMFAPGEDGNTSGESSRYTGFQYAYAGGPMSIQVSGESQRPVGASTTNTDAFLLGGSYDLGPAKVYVGYQKADGIQGEDEGYSLGVSAPIRAGTTLRVGYASDETTNATGAVKNGVVEGFSIDLGYQLAPNTDVYLMAASLTGSVDGEANDATYKEIGASLRYKF